MHLYKQLIHFEFALNLLSGMRVDRNEVLQIQHFSETHPVNYYLTRLAHKETNIDSDFLQATVIASLNEMLIV